MLLIVTIVYFDMFSALVAVHTAYRPTALYKSSDLRYFTLHSTVTVGVDVYDTRCDRVSYDPLTHSRHNGEV